MTIVGGHEMAETIGGSARMVAGLHGSGEENGDNCAWSSATSNRSMGGGSFLVQPLWSNAFNNNGGGCVLGARALPLDLRRAA